jgi:hypothetical protein
LQRLGLAVTLIEQYVRDGRHACDLERFAVEVMRAVPEQLDDPRVRLGYELPGDSYDPAVKHADLVRALESQLQQGTQQRCLPRYALLKKGVSYLGAVPGELDVFGIAVVHSMPHYHCFEAKTGGGARAEATAQCDRWLAFMHNDLGVSYERMWSYLVKPHRDGTPRIMALHGHDRQYRASDLQHCSAASGELQCEMKVK